MTRPVKKRRIGFRPGVTYFKPRAVPLSLLEEVILDMDEMETVRLSDFEKMSQEKASKKMGISQSTYQRILERARGKIAEALVEGKAIRMDDVLQ